MSGIEVAGVVLGALPLLIAAIQAHEKGLNPLTTLLYPSKHRTQLRRLDRQIRIQRDLFECSLSRLLSSQFNEKELDELFSQPHGPAWARTENKDKFENALHTTRSGCIIAIEDMAKTIQELQELLIASKLKFSLHQGKREQLISDMQNYNNSILAFVDHQRNLGTYKSGNFQGSKLQTLKSMQQKASDLFYLLNEIFSCDTSLSHIVNLHLGSTNMLDNPSQMKFRLLFVMSPLSSDEEVSSHWKRQEVETNDMISPEFEGDQSRNLCSALNRLGSSSKSVVPVVSLQSKQLPTFTIKPVAQPILSRSKPQTIVHLSEMIGQRSGMPDAERSSSW